MAALTFPVHVGDMPTFRFNMKDQDGDVFPVVGAQVQEAIFERPDRTTFTKPTVFTTDGSEGAIEYDTEDNTIINQPGTWKRQPHIVTSGGREFHGEKKVFDVDEILS